MTEGTTSVLPGDVIAGKYRVDRVLGAGGMGVVVAATHLQLDQKVALKFLLPALVTREEVVERFLREARAAVRIHSEHVSRVLDVGTMETGAPYMVMELLEGEDLEQVLARRGPLPVPEVVGYVLHACEALAEAHALGIVHRDLKPANLFLARRPSGAPTVKVLDFGISKSTLSSKQKALTAEASMMGSPAYMSPEQMRAASDVDVRSDIWSLGVVIHELLTQTLPFPGDTMTLMLASTLFEPHVPLHKARGDAPTALQPIIDRCLEKDPARRFPDVAELASALCPFGPPRSDVSLERILTVLGKQGAVPLDAGLGPPQAGAHFSSDPTVPVTGGLPAAGARTLSPTTRATPSGTGRRLLIPGVVLGALTAGTIAFALLRGHGAPPAILQADQPSAAAPSVAPSDAPRVAPSVTPTASATATVVAVASATAAPSATATASAATAPTGRVSLKPPGVAPNAAPSSTAAKPACKVVSYFDADGNKHFKQECP